MFGLFARRIRDFEKGFEIGARSMQLQIAKALEHAGRIDAAVIVLNAALPKPPDMTK